MSDSRNLQLPGNPRYQPKVLRDFLGYDNLYRYVAEVEIAALKTLADFGVIPDKSIALLTPELEDALMSIRTSEVDSVEREITKHDIRAWVRLAQEILPVPLRRWAHVPLTSYDALDTARALMFLRTHVYVVQPMVKEVGLLFSDLAERNAATVQIGRTHGQHALPITVGFWFATILSRIMTNAKALDIEAAEFCGKISGAVGAYNAQIGLRLSVHPHTGMRFENAVLRRLDLEPASISTQILPPEPLANYLHACVLMSATFGQFGRDARHLMRSEIGEISEEFVAGQVGSSTMAHKRNPITFENIEGMWLRTKNEYGKVLDTLVSEHQRDLVGSCVARDYPIIVVNLVQQLSSLLRKDKAGRPFLARITVDKERCLANLRAAGDKVLAEPMYIALQMAGYEGDAHEVVNHAVVPLASSCAQPQMLNALDEVAKGDPELADAVGQISTSMRDLHKEQTMYIGSSAHKAREIADAARSMFSG